MYSLSNLSSSLKLVYIFSVNPYLGPLQVSLSRMVLDIMKFFILYILVLFAFSCGKKKTILNQRRRLPSDFSLFTFLFVLVNDNCVIIISGLNQLLWYYADLEKQACYEPKSGKSDLDACIVWRRFAK